MWQMNDSNKTLQNYQLGKVINTAGDLSLAVFHKVKLFPLWLTLMKDSVSPVQGSAGAVCRKAEGQCALAGQYLRRRYEKGPFMINEEGATWEQDNKGGL